MLNFDVESTLEVTDNFQINGSAQALCLSPDGLLCTCEVTVVGSVVEEVSTDMTHGREGRFGVRGVEWVVKVVGVRWVEGVVVHV